MLRAVQHGIKGRIFKVLCYVLAYIPASIVCIWQQL